MIPVIDIFAGPGGLGEGFSSLEVEEEEKPFDVVLSIENDPHAYETLKLRSFFHQFKKNKVPSDYYSYLKGEMSLEDLYNKHPRETNSANTKTWKETLGEIDRSVVLERIQQSLKSHKNYVLVGGPPCQAYSIAGRSRNAGNKNYNPEKDLRQYLYIEFLQFITDSWPAVFVMENVKGLLSATLKNQNIFKKILDDLKNPADAIRREKRLTNNNKKTHTYKIFSLTTGEEADCELKNIIIKSEDFRIPQKRHRIILVGIRDDLNQTIPFYLKKSAHIQIKKVLSDLPKIRSGLSKLEDNSDSWIECLKSATKSNWFKKMKTSKKKAHEILFKSILENIFSKKLSRGKEFIIGKSRPSHNPEWFIDKNLKGFCNHTSRSHIEEDLFRYFYATCYAKKNGISPKIEDFPTELYPKHKSAKSGIFSDRFRVQLEHRPATTITSHISKDGHYYIHPDPLQCRSLTVREAARIQTFPDNFLFSGPRTSQYHQVGNAVPPLLSRQIAAIVFQILKNSGIV